MPFGADVYKRQYEVPARTAQQASALNDALAELDGRVLFIPYGVRQRDSQLIETYVARDVYICLLYTSRCV